RDVLPSRLSALPPLRASALVGSFHALSLLYPPAYHRSLPPFPTRRSSDLTSPASIPPPSRPGSPTMPPATSSRSPIRSATESWRSEEHTSELQSLTNLVCRLLLDKKNWCAAQAVREARMQNLARSASRVTA